MSLLQAMMYDPQVIPMVLQRVQPEAFSMYGAVIYEAIRELNRDGLDPDIGLVTDRAARKVPDIIQVFDIDSLSGGNVIVAGNWEEHCRVLVDNYVVQTAVNEAGRIASSAMNGQVSTEEIPGLFLSGARAISGAMDGRSPIASINQSGSRFIDRIMQTMAGEINVAIPTFIPGLDEHFKGGWHKGLLHTLFGPPGTGKSAAVDWSILMAALKGEPSLMLSFEMPEHELLGRFVSILCGVPFQISDLSPEPGPGDRPLREPELVRLNESILSALTDVRKISTISNMAMAATSVLSELPIHIYDRALAIEEIEAKIVSHVAQYPTSIIVIDHMRKMRQSRRAKSKYEDLDEAFSILGDLAISTDTAIIAVSQPKSELKPGDTPEMHHLSYAGEQPTQRLIGLQVAGGGNMRFRRMRAHILKNRNGPVGGIVSFVMDMATFTAFQDGAIEHDTHPNPPE